jgi:hypothetical protein
MKAFVTSRHPQPASTGSPAGEGPSETGTAQQLRWINRDTTTHTAGQAENGAQAEAADGSVVAGPRRWLRLEAAVLLGGCLVAFPATHRSWWLVAVALLLPDLVMVGYLGGTRLGAIFYNAAHSAPAPAVLIGLGWWQHEPLVLAIGLIWLAHIGMDRLMGYGLKYDDHFGHTHLGRIGKTTTTSTKTQP